jgi:hypothetical protein
MAYTQQLINKEDHLLACTTRMFEYPIITDQDFKMRPYPNG